jgi:hypothetical protein
VLDVLVAVSSLANAPRPKSRRSDRSILPEPHVLRLEGAIHRHLHSSGYFSRCLSLCLTAITSSVLKCSTTIQLALGPALRRPSRLRYHSPPAVLSSNQRPRLRSPAMTLALASAASTSSTPSASLLSRGRCDPSLVLQNPIHTLTSD